MAAYCTYFLSPPLFFHLKFLKIIPFSVIYGDFRHGLYLHSAHLVDVMEFTWLVPVDGH